MKTSCINKLARVSGVAIALALFASGSGEIRAGEILFRGGAQQLLPATAPAGPSDYKPMSCAKCKSEWIARTENTSRGVIKPSVLVERHLCNGCDTTITTVGRGKQATDVAVHKCTECGAETLACCSTSKRSVAATKGMEKKFEVAPLK